MTRILSGNRKYYVVACVARIVDTSSVDLRRKKLIHANMGATRIRARIFRYARAYMDAEAEKPWL